MRHLALQSTPRYGSLAEMSTRLQACLLIALTLAAKTPAASIFLVQGTTSNPVPAERRFAEKQTRRLSAWLADLNIQHSVIDDDDVIQGLPSSARLLILGYNPNPPSSEVRALKHFVKRGGKLIVFYGADPDLASLMGFKLGPYRSGGETAPWHAVCFNGMAPEHLPAVVRQHSRNMRPVYPKEPGSAIIAQWEDASGQLLDDPAWLSSPYGFWMTHVLRDDGDTWNKKRMLAGLIGVLEPGIWPAIAERALDRAATLDHFASYEDTVSAIRSAVKSPSRRPEVELCLTAAAALFAQQTALLANSNHTDVVNTSETLRLKLVEALGLAQLPRLGEFRGVWDHQATGLYPGDWPRTCRLLASQGVTAVFSNAMWPGVAHYDSRQLSHSQVFDAYGDQIRQFVTAAHSSGLKAHVWKVCWRLDRAPADVVASLRKQGRLQVSDSGQTLDWLCPSHPDNLRMEKDAVREVVSTYDVDGIHLDYIRYPDSHACYCPGCRTRFEQSVGRPLTQWPPPGTALLLRKKFRDWRAAQHTRLVQDLSVATKRINPDIEISAAVFGRYPLCVDSVGQDWGLWLRNGYVDFVCPMNYTTDGERFSELVRDQLALPGANGRIFPGIGATAAESRLDELEVIEQINALRDAGAAGFVLFDLNPIMEKEILPVLRLGITASP